MEAATTCSLHNFLYICEESSADSGVKTQIAGIRWANVSIWRWPNVGYPRWSNVILLIGPTLAQLVGITLGQRGFVLHFHWANVGPMWLLHVYFVFSLD